MRARPRRPLSPSRSPRAQIAPGSAVRRPATAFGEAEARHWDHSPRWLRVGAGYAWRFLVIAAAVLLLAMAVKRLELAFIALFGAFVITAVLRPLTGLLARWMPRSLATALSYVAAVGAFAGLVTFITVSISNQYGQLSSQFVDGIENISKWAQEHLPTSFGELSVDKLGQRIINWVGQNSDKLSQEALSRAGAVVELFTGLALAVFCSIFFIYAGGRMWRWFLFQLPQKARAPWSAAGSEAWATFSGYTRGIFLVAASNGLLAGIGLAILRVPLAAPLGVLVFLGTFVPLIGAPVAMVIATVVALATRPPIVAVIVLLMIVLIGQFEGHVLQPLIMGRQVDLHPVVVAVTVVCGTLLGGVIGAIVAVPLVSVAWSVFDRLRHPIPPFTMQPDTGPPGARARRREREYAAQDAVNSDPAKLPD